MPGKNLTRDEARERAELLSVATYDVALDLTTGPSTFRTRCREDEEVVPAWSLSAVTRSSFQVWSSGAQPNNRPASAETPRV